MKLAVLLIAGGGSRLNNISGDLPKCMVPVAGQPLLERILSHLKKGGIEKIILVTGYQADYIRQSIGDRWNSVKIEYIYSSKWSTTNNVVSLDLASECINQNFMLLEGDLIFTWEALEKMFYPNRMAVDHYKSFMDGTVVSIADDQIVDKIYLKSDSERPVDLSNMYKTVNIYSFDYVDYLNVIAPRLEMLIKSDQTQVYYEQAIADAVDSGDITINSVLFTGTPWYEIDTEQDFLQAEEMFNSGK